MTLRPLLRLGDPTTGGGRLVQVAAARFQVEGRPVATRGDLATCALPGHPPLSPLVDGDPACCVHGRPVARDGARLACGCQVHATTRLVQDDEAR